MRELGGADYNALEPKALDAEGRVLPGGGGYRYFGAARELPGVKELFERPAPVKRKRTRADMFKNVTPDYYGFRDDDDEKLGPAEALKEADQLSAAVAEETESRQKRRQKRKEACVFWMLCDTRTRLQPDEEFADSSDDDPEAEAAFLAEVDRVAAVIPASPL